MYLGIQFVIKPRAIVLRTTINARLAATKEYESSAPHQRRWVLSFVVRHAFIYFTNTTNISLVSDTQVSLSSIATNNKETIGLKLK